MKLKLFYFFLIFVFVGMVSSCGKTAENKIVGAWNKVSVGPIDNVIKTWTFTADHHLYVSYTDTSIKVDSLKVQQDTATWRITIHTLRKNTIKINQVDAKKSISFPHVAGEFEIRELDDILVLQRVKLENGETDGAYFWHEFEKKN